ncbi:hypothetical protein J6590_076922 [Homalodisca vitripennis]|nr:hypothetical protein J6590_076922 [Homalodisca vitripennis]
MIFSSPIETSPTTSSSVIPALEELKKHGANTKNKGVSLRSSDSLFGLGIGANLLGVHAGAGIGHGRGGYGDMGQGFLGKPAGGHYPQSGISDLTAQLRLCNFNYPNQRITNIHRSFWHKTLQELKSLLEYENWREAIEARTVDDAYKSFITTLTSNPYAACPSKTARPKKKKKPKHFVDEETLRLKNE